MMKKLLFLCLVLIYSGIGNSQTTIISTTVETVEEEQANSIGLNSEVSYLMMEHNQNLRKVEAFMESKADGLIADRSLSFGFNVVGLLDYQDSNRDSKFGYLMRHPTSNNQIGETTSEAVIHSAQLSMISSINSWLSAYGELLYSPEQSFGTGTITSLGRNQVEFRKGILFVGNLEKFPIFAALGKMDVAFGQMGSVSPFTNTSMWHAFGPLAYGLQVGFKKYGLSINLTAIQGGSQFRAANVTNNGTSVPNRLDNYSADLSYTLDITNDIALTAGASYLKGSTYCHSFPVTHFFPCEETNSATAFYGNLRVGNKIFLKGGYIITDDVWPGTFNPALPEFAASKVSSLDLGGRYTFNPDGNVAWSLSGEFSNFIAGPEGSPWERQNQLVIGINAQVEKTNRLFLEFVKVDGFSPLNFISGGNNPADPTFTHSDKDARSLVFVLGGMLSI
jgi:hypothetical protein